MNPAASNRRPASLPLLARALLSLSALASCAPGCGKPGAPAAAPLPPRAAPTVASAVPSATDLLIGMGAGDHLVGVANVGENMDGVRGLPRIGDYRDFDWEKLAGIRPDLLIVFMAPDRMPPGLKEKAAGLHVRLANVRVETLDDVFRALQTLGALVHEPGKAAAAEQRLRRRLDAVRSRVAGRPRVRTVLTVDPGALAVAGRGTFLSDALEVAGGENVIETVGWPAADPERLRSLRPDAAVQLLPDATPQALAQARQVWSTMPDLPAVAAGRVYTLRDTWALQPGSHVADLAERLAGFLHPEAAAPPAAAGGVAAP